jgi:hypothetical protein
MGNLSHLVTKAHGHRGGVIQDIAELASAAPREPETPPPAPAAAFPRIDVAPAKMKPSEGDIQEIRRQIMAAFE